MHCESQRKSLTNWPLETHRSCARGRLVRLGHGSYRPGATRIVIGSVPVYENKNFQFSHLWTCASGLPCCLFHLRALFVQETFKKICGDGRSIQSDHILRRVLCACRLALLDPHVHHELSGDFLGGLPYGSLRISLRSSCCASSPSDAWEKSAQYSDFRNEPSCRLLCAQARGQSRAR